MRKRVAHTKCPYSRFSSGHLAEDPPAVLDPADSPGGGPAGIARRPAARPVRDRPDPVHARHPDRPEPPLSQTVLLSDTYFHPPDPTGPVQETGAKGSSPSDVVGIAGPGC
jgi:hypothetical protein